MGSRESNEDVPTCQKPEEKTDNLLVIGIAAAAAVAFLAAWGLSKLFGGSEPERKTMKAPGRDQRLFRDVFESDPSAYFRGLRKYSIASAWK